MNLHAERAPSVTKQESFTVAIVLVVGAVLRLWGAGSFGIDHYDEGVYVLSAMGLGDASLPQRLFPDQIFFAPPLYIVLVGLAHALFGIALDTTAVIVSAFFGTLTIALVWWVGRSWFTPGAGVAAAALLALSDFHIALSRSALTDATFLFFFLLAAWLIVRALESGGILAALLAGLATGLAWNTKYHGWMALAAAAAAYVLLIIRRGMPERWRRDLVVWLVMSGTAVALYLPWATHVASLPGGYARLTMHQRLFLESDWLTNLWMQVQRQGYLDARLTDFSVLAAAAAALLAIAGSGLAVRAIVTLGILAGGGFVIGGWAIVLVLALAGLLWAHRLVRMGPAMAATWCALFAALTPFYRPYARLFLPLTLAVCMLGGYGLSVILSWRRSGGRSSLEAIAVLACAAIIFLAIGSGARTADPLRPSRGAAEAAASMAETIPRGSRVKVIEEPPLTYYLYTMGFDTLRDAAGVAVPADEPETIYVVTGPYGQDAQLVSLGERVQLRGTWRMQVKDLRLVDDIEPPYEEERESEIELKLYVVAPRGR